MGFVVRLNFFDFKTFFRHNFMVHYSRKFLVLTAKSKIEKMIWKYEYRFRDIFISFQLQVPRR